MIFYEVVVAKTAEDNENWRYIKVGKYLGRKQAEKKAAEVRTKNPDYAFIVLEKHTYIKKDWGTLEHDHETDNNPEVLEHY